MKHVIALAGNPNSGKTTLFNALTGSRQQVGNWPGVTVERKEGHFRHKETDFEAVDLPGIYMMSAFSLDEKVSRDFILSGNPELAVNIVDATNLERNLYLTLMLLEMKIPVVIALNMMDLAKERKLEIDTDRLSKLLGCPVVPISASKKEGMDKLKDTILESIQNRKISPIKVTYDSEVEKAIAILEPLCKSKAEQAKLDTRWLAVKALEREEKASELCGDLNSKIAELTTQISGHTGETPDMVIADGRYGFIHGLTREVIRKDLQYEHGSTEVIDKIVLNRVLGLPIFFLAMYLTFYLTVNVGSPFIDIFDGVFNSIFVEGAGALYEKLGFPVWLITLLTDGIGAGITTVSTFIPPITIIFICLSILEDSGYMARAAFVMDRLFRALGLPGKAFIPMMVGFGCNVPAIMSTRTLDSRRDRLLSILINPFMSCGARLPVYALFGAAFFGADGGILLFSLYMTGVVLALLSGWLFSGSLLKGESSCFVLELPPYHIPTFSGIFLHTWERLKEFIIRAGKVIIVVVLLLGVLNSIGTDGSFGNTDSEKSVLSHIGRSITPIFKPMGMTEENWPAAVGLFTGLFAKESIIGTLESLYAQKENKEFAEDAPDEEKEEFATNTLQKYFGNARAAVAYLLFVLIYVPCVAAMAAIAQEAGKKWAAFSIAYLLGLAWVVATVYYQIGMLKSNPGDATFWLVVCGIAVAAFIVVIKKFGPSIGKFLEGCEIK